MRRMTYCTLENYRKLARDHNDDNIMKFLKSYRPTGYNRNSLDRIDHRQFRREVIHEALRRGLIAKDPGDAP